jgi:hypothetical protein
MSLREVRRRCERLLDEVDLPDPFDANVFRDAVAERRGRPIRLVPQEHMVGPCGVLVSMQDVDYVFFEGSTSPVHRDHIIAHELGHLLCEHLPKERLGDEVLRALMPDLNPAMVRKALARTSYDGREEREAEMIASLTVGRRPVHASVSDPALDRLHRSLGATGS